MQYSPKLKRVMEDIKAILKEEDIAGTVVLHTPGFSEFLLKIDPSYSCAFIEREAFRIKSTHLKSKKEKKQKLTDTANMLNHLSEVNGRLAMNLIDASEFIDNKLNSNHFGGGMTSHEQQNN